jgi:hypothetical protein
MQLHVVPCSARVMCDLLLGVPFINGNATWVDVPTLSELVYRPLYIALQVAFTMYAPHCHHDHSACNGLAVGCSSNCWLLAG